MHLVRFVGQQIFIVLVPFFAIEFYRIVFAETYFVAEFGQNIIGNSPAGVFIALFQRAVKIPNKQLFHLDSIITL